MGVIATTFWTAKTGRDALRLVGRGKRLQVVGGGPDGRVQAAGDHTMDPGAQGRRRRQGHRRRRQTNRGVLRVSVSRARRDGADELRREVDRRRVRNLEREQFRWGTALAAGQPGDKRGRGIAVHESFGTVVAQVAEVTIDKDGNLRVDRVVCAVHCGTAVNPDIVKAQMEGGIGFGLSAALYGRITLKYGVVEQSNYHGYTVLRITQMPAVEVHIVASSLQAVGGRGTRGSGHRAGRGQCDRSRNGEAIALAAVIACMTGGLALPRRVSAPWAPALALKRPERVAGIGTGSRPGMRWPRCVG